MSSPTPIRASNRPNLKHRRRRRDAPCEMCSRTGVFTHYGPRGYRDMCSRCYADGRRRINTETTDWATIRGSKAPTLPPIGTKLEPEHCSSPTIPSNESSHQADAMSITETMLSLPASNISGPHRNSPHPVSAVTTVPHHLSSRLLEFKHENRLNTEVQPPEKSTASICSEEETVEAVQRPSQLSHNPTRPLVDIPPSELPLLDRRHSAQGAPQSDTLANPSKTPRQPCRELIVFLKPDRESHKETKLTPEAQRRATERDQELGRLYRRVRELETLRMRTEGDITRLGAQSSAVSNELHRTWASLKWLTDEVTNPDQQERYSKDGGVGRAMGDLGTSQQLAHGNLPVDYQVRRSLLEATRTTIVSTLKTYMDLAEAAPAITKEKTSALGKLEDVKQQIFYINLDIERLLVAL